jgi:hypothetical protein
MRSNAPVAVGSGGVALVDDAAPQAPAAAIAMSSPPTVDPPPLPTPARARTMRQIITLAVNDPRFGLGAVALFLVLVVFGLDGAVLPWLWTDVVDGDGGLLWPVVGIVAALMLTAPMPYYTASGSPSGGSARCCGSACASCTGRPAPAGSAGTPRPRWWRRAVTPNASSSSPTT